jgi:nicotinate phosphoribosyltransferase
VKLFLSRRLDEYQILKYNPFAEAYGVGAATSKAPVVDFSMDIVEIEGKPIAKRGKMSVSKRVLRCGACSQTFVLPFEKQMPVCLCRGKTKNLLIPHFQQGKLKEALLKPGEIREYIKQLEKVDLGAEKKSDKG